MLKFQFRPYRRQLIVANNRRWIEDEHVLEHVSSRGDKA